MPLAGYRCILEGVAFDRTTAARGGIVHTPKAIHEASLDGFDPVNRVDSWPENPVMKPYPCLAYTQFATKC